MSNVTERLLINLRIIAQVQPFQRLNAKAELFGIESNTYWSSWSRWLRADDRDVCMRRVGEIIDECATLLEKDGTHEKLRGKINSSLTMARRGLGNLKKTYEDCVRTSAIVDLLMEKITDLIPEAESEEEREL